MIKNIFSQIDPVAILQFGVIGLGFLLALFSYDLLRKEQKREIPRKELLRSISAYMTFSIVLCLIGVFADLVKPDLKKKDSVKQNFRSHLLSGTVIDELTNKSVQQAEISIVGRNEQYFTEENGNFAIQLNDSIKSVRIRVLKKYFKPFDKTYDLPSEGIIIQLLKIEK